MRTLLTLLCLGLLYTVRAQEQLTLGDLDNRIRLESVKARVLYKTQKAKFNKRYDKQIKECYGSAISPYEIAKLYVVDKAIELGRFKPFYYADKTRTKLD